MKLMLGKAALAIGSLVLWLGLIEGGLRLWGFAPEQRPNLVFSWNRLGELWLLEPNTKSKTRIGGHPIVTNSIGLRDREFSARTPGVPRILFLGDSVTFGHALPIQNAFVRRMVRQAAARGVALKVVNAGIPGWSTRQQLLFYEQYGARLQPDVVLLGFVLNDVRELKNNIDGAGAQGGLEAVNAVSWLSERTATVHLLKKTYVAVVTPQVRELGAVEELVQKGDESAVVRAMDLTRAELTKLADLVRARGQRFGLVIFPFDFQFAEPGLDGPQQLLREWGREAGVPVLDTLPILREYPVKMVLLDHTITSRGSATTGWRERFSTGWSVKGSWLRVLRAFPEQKCVDGHLRG
ncbi:MAG: hypothetical protein CL938_20305 [Deltaproteobacteria bacterium]|jgi:hypothetical protein|nr:hypothetical protein [Deltaproteobacteria bacterium]